MFFKAAKAYSNIQSVYIKRKWPVIVYIALIYGYISPKIAITFITYEKDDPQDVPR